MSNNRLFIIPSGGGGLDPTNYYTRSEVDALIADFITNTVDDLTNYYLKSETYTQTEVNNLIAAIDQFHYEIYASTSAVTDPQSNVLYLIGPSQTASGDLYEEYVYSNSTWTKIGDTSVDLSGYVTTTDLATALNDYVTTAGLTTTLADYVTTLALGTVLSDYTPTAQLSTVATTGAYSDLTGTPTLATVATTGQYSDLSGTPTLATVAETGDYADLTGTPTLATVATSGDYADLTGTPNLSTVATTGAYSDLSGTPTLATVATTGDYTDLTNTPNLAAVATTGAYSDLTGTPTLATVATTGNYADLSGTPTIPTVGTGTVTLTQNGATIGTFGLNDTDDKTIEIPAGGSSSNAWYGTMAQFNALGTSADPDTDYFISDPIKYSEIQNTPDLTVYETKTASQAADAALHAEIAVKADPIVFVGTGGISTIGTPLEGVTYAIEGETLPLTFTLDGIGTVTYNFVID